MEQQILLEKYLNNSLTTTEFKYFKKLMNSNETFQKEVKLRKLMQKIVKVGVRKRFLEGLEEAKKMRQTTKEQEVVAERKVDNLIKSSSAFQKNQVYEREIRQLAGSSRTRDEMNLISPMNEQIIQTSQLDFVFETVLPSEIILRIENNQAMQPILELIIPPNTSIYYADLPINQFPEGRYYWKLWNNSSNDFLMGSFFVITE